MDGLFDIGGEVQAAGGDIAPDHFLQPGFEDGDAAVFQDADFSGSTSRQSTSLPTSARQVPLTRPT